MCSNVATKKICWSNHVQSDHSQDLSMVHVLVLVIHDYPAPRGLHRLLLWRLSMKHKVTTLRPKKLLRVCRSRHGGEHGKKSHQRKICLEDDFNEVTFTSLMHTPSVTYYFIVQADRARRLALQKELEETPWFATAWLPGHRKTQKTNETSRVCTCFLITEALGFPMPVLPLPVHEGASERKWTWETGAVVETMMIRQEISKICLHGCH